jgi:hypothetical protein
VIVHLIGSGLPDETYQDYDLATLEDRLIEVVAHSESDEYDGNEFGEGETILYLYGPNAETLFSAIEGTLRGYPLCQNARVVIRHGPPVHREEKSSLAPSTRLQRARKKARAAKLGPVLRRVTRYAQGQVAQARMHYHKAQALCEMVSDRQHGPMVAQELQRL